MTPPQKPGRSKQDYQTPPAFVAAVKAMLGIEEFAMDLAASRENSVTGGVAFYGEAEDSLKQAWWQLAAGRWCWLNPPFARIGPWVEKADEECELGQRIAMLLPAGIGTDWYAKHVHGKCHVLALRPRLTFVGETAPYPKDLMLCLYDGPRVGFSTWDWRTA